jgi:IS30 family transposase
VKFYSLEVRAAACRALAAGWSAQSVGLSMGIPRRTIIEWGMLSGMTFVIGRSGGVVRPPAPARSRGEVSYRRLTLAGRSFIQAARSLPEPLSIRAIAAELAVAPSTVSRELRQHRMTRRGAVPRYDADVAHFAALVGRARTRDGKLTDPRLRRSVVEELNRKSSPQQVAGRLKLIYPNAPEMHVSHETIYQALYIQGKGALRDELKVVKALRSGRTERVPKSKLPRRSSRPWLEGARLADRPAEVTDRAVPGHWEGDLVVGPENSGIVTLIERQTRFCLIGRLPGARDSRTVIDVLTTLIHTLPAELAKTITWDQGNEMAQHRSFTIATGCPVFFCDPHSPWQRGSNENLNGLIRDFYPKGTNFNTVTDTDIANMQDLLNIRPRMTLGYHNPHEMLSTLITGVALAP